MLRRRTTLAVMGAGLMALVACSTSGGSSGESSDHATDSTKTERGWVRKDLHPITQPLAVDGHLVLYAAGKEDPRLLALDPATGETEWEQDASASGVTPGVAPTVAAVGDLVVYFRDDGNDQTAEITAVNVGTGKTAWRGDTAEFSDWPAPCFDDPTSICTTGYRGGDDVEALRYEGSSGEEVASSPIPGGNLGRALASGLYDTGNRDPEQMSATEAKGEVWTKDLSEIFPGEGLSTDTGWNFDRLPKVGLFVGSLGPKIDDLGGGRSRVDLATLEVAGFGIADGTVAWRAAGAIYGCNVLPCPGAPVSSPTEGAVPTAGVRLRFSGTVTSTEGDDTASWSPDGKVVVEGFDQRTGRATWTYDAGHSQELVDGVTFPQVDEAAIVVKTPADGHVQLDLATGGHKRVAEDALAWCSKETDYKVTPPFGSGDQKTSEYTGQSARYPCHPDGSRAEPPAKVPAWVGAAAKGHIAWSEADKVVSVEAGA